MSARESRASRGAEGNRAPISSELERELAPYDYDLPPDRIAEEPGPSRGVSRLLILDRRDGSTKHRRFPDLGKCLHAGDLLVLNDTRVIPARLRAVRRTGGAVVLLLVEEADGEAGTWWSLLQPARAGRPGERLQLVSPADIGVVVRERRGECYAVEFTRSGRILGHDEVMSLCDRAGEPPLPPYIRREPGDPRHDRDRERYQTVYACRPGAVAAPTAGLHFSEEMLAMLEDSGVERVTLTLHVGLGTFRPLRAEDLHSGKLHAERVEVPAGTGERVLAARREGRRIVAVGTTTVRALESFAAAGAPLPFRGRTDMFIRPGHEFRLVDALLTNFHLPRSSLLLLVSAFAGREVILSAYREAIAKEYLFYSYGDAMLIL